MALEIVKSLPPSEIYERLVFSIPQVRAARRPVFTVGSVLYNPSGTDIPDELMAHEKVHSQRQGRDPGGWWKRYTDDLRFRFLEELAGHVAEYEAFCKLHGDRNRRNMALHRIAVRLASPLYGGLVTYGDAKEEILLAQH